MDFLVDTISNFLIQHPFSQVLCGYILKIVGVLFVLLLVTACFYLALSKKHVYQFPMGSIGGLCWKAAWLLGIVVIVDISYRIYTGGTKNMFSSELFVCCVPITLALFAMLYSITHDKTFHLERRHAREKGKGTSKGEKEKHL